MTDTAIVPTQSTRIELYSESARKYARKSKADNTLRAYRFSWREFQTWCQIKQVSALPAQPMTVTEYISQLADRKEKVSTIQIKLSAIAYRHRTAGHDDPTTTEVVRAVMAGIRRELKSAPNKKAPITRTELRQMVRSLPDTLAGKRDKAMLLVGFAGAFRRSEIVDIDIADIRLSDALRITLKKSKTDQEGKGFVKVIPPMSDKTIDPLTALRDWLTASQITSGPLFRKIDRWGHVLDRRLTAQSVALIVKSMATRAGLTSIQFAGHSLRSGFITEAANAGVESRDIMAQTGHKSEAVMRGYIQDAGLGAAGAVRAAFGEKRK